MQSFSFVFTKKKNNKRYRTALHILVRKKKESGAQMKEQKNLEGKLCDTFSGVLKRIFHKKYILMKELLYTKPQDHAINSISWPH